MRVSEVQTRIGGSIRIHYDPFIFNSPEMAKFYTPDAVNQEDDRIGNNLTTIHVPKSIDVASTRYHKDELFREIVKMKARRHHTDPHSIMRKYAGSELREKNRHLGIEHHSNSDHNDNTPISIDSTTNNGCNREIQPHRVVRLIKEILP